MSRSDRCSLRERKAVLEEAGIKTLDPTKYPDGDIAMDAEKRMKTVYELADQMGLESRELLPYGHYMGKIDAAPVLDRLGKKPDGKYIDVTAITPTPLGEGKSTTTIGLVQGLGRRGKRCSAAIRQPSGGPTMGIKGSAAGGGDVPSAFPFLNIPSVSPEISMPFKTPTIWPWWLLRHACSMNATTATRSCWPCRVWIA